MAGSSIVPSHASLVGFARACSRTPAPRCQGRWAVLSTTDFFVAFQFSGDRASVYVGCTCAPHTTRLFLDDYHYFLMKLAIMVLFNDADCPDLSSIEHFRQDDRFVHPEFGVEVETVVTPYSVLWMTESLTDFRDPANHSVISFGAT
nr:unnamed protein product [Spirometra erinaceieuropaei]